MTDKRRHRPWSEEEHAEAVGMARAGHSAAKIARRIGRTPAAVKSRLHGVIRDESTPCDLAPDGRVTWTPGDDARLVDLTLAGRSVGQTAEAMGRSSKAITARRRQLRDRGELEPQRPGSGSGDLPEGYAHPPSSEIDDRVRTLGRLVGYR